MAGRVAVLLATGEIKGQEVREKKEEAKQRHEQSDKGQETRQRHEQTSKRKKARQLLALDNPGGGKSKIQEANYFLIELNKKLLPNK